MPALPASGASKAPRKNAYFEKLRFLLENYTKILTVQADYVGSRQMAEIRLALRGRAVVLMGKNTTIRTALRQMLAEHPEFAQLLPLIKDNVGLVFCTGDEAGAVRKTILDNRVPAAAKQGVVATCDVVVPAGPTGLDPGQTSFFQALSVGTKIVKGQIEIQSNVDLIKEGERVSASQAALLQKLNIRPFSHGLAVKQIYDAGVVYDAKVLDIADAEILAAFSRGVQNVAAFGRATGLPNAASAPHSVLEAFKFCVAAVLETDYEFPQMEPIKKLLAAAA